MERGDEDLLVGMHRQAWRADAAPLDVSLEELVGVMPALIETGSVGLVWPRLRHRAEAYGAVGMALERAYESQAAHNRTVEADIARVVSRLGEAGIRPVLIKGLAVARLYPEGLIRTAGDIDLVLRDEEYADAMALLTDVRLSFHRDYEAERARRGAQPSDPAGDVDLHRFSAWGEAVDDSFFADAREVSIGGAMVRVPDEVDHLRALCLHFMRHAAVRPLRLCDIALLAEAVMSGGAWGRLLRGTRREVEQVVIALRLAEEMLGAHLEGAPGAVRGRSLPGWLVSAVRRQWVENPTPPGPVLNEVLAHPRGIVRTFRRRWPDPITATLRIRVPFNNVPRLPIQGGAFAFQMVDYATHRLVRQMQERRAKATG